MRWAEFGVRSALGGKCGWRVALTRANLSFWEDFMEVRNIFDRTSQYDGDEKEENKKLDMHGYDSYLAFWGEIDQLGE